MTKTTVVNLYGGPGSGKSTTAHGLVHILKSSGIEAEFAHEWIKHPVWQGRIDFPQYYVWAKQQKMIDGLIDKVDVIVTDSPTLLSLIYGTDEFRSFHQFVIDKFHTVPSLNIYITRVKPFWEKGRYQTEEEARGLDRDIHTMLHDVAEVEHDHFPGDQNTPRVLADRVLSLLH
jgi:hypothetical protein